MKPLLLDINVLQERLLSIYIHDGYDNLYCLQLKKHKMKGQMNVCFLICKFKISEINTKI